MIVIFRFYAMKPSPCPRLRWEFSRLIIGSVSDSIAKVCLRAVKPLQRRLFGTVPCQPNRLRAISPIEFFRTHNGYLSLDRTRSSTGLFRPISLLLHCVISSLSLSYSPMPLPNRLMSATNHWRWQHYRSPERQRRKMFPG